MLDYEWEIGVLKNVIQNMENGTTDFDFLMEQMASVIDSVEEKEQEQE